MNNNKEPSHGSSTQNPASKRRRVSPTHETAATGSTPVMQSTQAAQAAPARAPQAQSDTSSCSQQKPYTTAGNGIGLEVHNASTTFHGATVKVPSGSPATTRQSSARPHNNGGQQSTAPARAPQAQSDTSSPCSQPNPYTTAGNGWFRSPQRFNHGSWSNR